MRLNLMKRVLAALAFVALLGPSGALAATLYISEFQNAVGVVGTTQAQMLPQSAITDQTVAIGGSSVQSAAFNAKTHAVALTCDLGCSIVIGTDPTATTSNFLLYSGHQQNFVVAPGQKIAVIDNPAGNPVDGGGGAVTIADCADTAEGCVADAAATAGGTGTVSAKLRRLSTQIPAAVGQTTMSASMPVAIASNQTAVPTSNATQLPAALGQTTMAASLPVTLASNQSTITDQPAGWSFQNITTSTTTTVKSGAGVLHIVNVNTLGTIASTVTVYDNTAGSGTKIATINSLSLSGPFQYDIAFSTGLTIVTTGTSAPDITVSYR